MNKKKTHFSDNDGSEEESDTSSYLVSKTKQTTRAKPLNIGSSSKNMNIALIRTIAKQERKATIECIQNMKQDYIKEISRLSQTVENISSFLHEHIPMMSLAVGGSGRHAVTQGKSLQPQNELNLRLNILRKDLESRSHPQLIGNVLLLQVCSYMKQVCNEHESINLSRRCVSVFLFGHQRNMTKSTWQVGLSKQHADFRFAIVFTLLTTMKLEFSPPSTSPNCTQPSTRNSNNTIETSKNKETQPEKISQRTGNHWLVSNFPSKEIVRFARKIHEVPKSKLPKINMTKKQNESLFICSSLYSIVMDFLRRAREESKSRFFEYGGFLFSKWWLEGDEKNKNIPPVITFKTEDSYNPLLVPEAILRDNCNYVEENQELLKRLYLHSKNLFFHAEYDVYIVDKHQSGRVKKHSAREKRKVRRDIHLIDLAFQFYLGMSLQQPEQDVRDQFLSMHKDSMRVFYRTAHVFKNILLERKVILEKRSVIDFRKNRLRSHHSNREDEEQDDPAITAELNRDETYAESSDQEKCFRDLTFDALIPGTESIITSVLTRNLLLSKDEYVQISTERPEQNENNDSEVIGEKFSFCIDSDSGEENLFDVEAARK